MERSHRDVFDSDTEDEDEEEWRDTTWSQVDPTQARATGQNQHVIKGVSLLVAPPSEQQQNEGEQSLLSRMKLNDNKAGMEGLDKEKINKIIHDASKGSKYYENELKKEEHINRRIDDQKRQIAKLSGKQLSEGSREADKLLEELEKERDLSRTIVHVDMDAFYAAVEMRDNPALHDKPMAVGGNSMLSTSNYIARRYGVRAAMPGFIGRKLCPDLVIVPCNFDKYTAVSKQVREIFSDYDTNFCPMSLDEAYLDFTDHLIKRVGLTEQQRTYQYRLDPKLYCQCVKATPKESSLSTFNKSNEGNIVESSEISSLPEQSAKGVNVTSDLNPNTPISDSSSTEGDQKMRKMSCNLCGKIVPDDTAVKTELFDQGTEEAVREMRFRIQQTTQLTASAGIAPNMMLAKVCSDKNKPNGQYRIQPTREAVMEFVNDLPIRKICGIGKVSEKMLNAVGIVKCPDIYYHRQLLFHLHSKVSFYYFMRICLGIGSTQMDGDSERKSMSTERTFSEISKPKELFSKCYELCQSLSEDLQGEDLMGKTVTLKIKTVKFQQKTRAQSLKIATKELEPIYAVAQELLRAEIQACHPEPLKLRLMGVRMSNFQTLDSSEQKQKTITGFFQKPKSKMHHPASVSVVPSSESTETSQSPVISSQTTKSDSRISGTSQREDNWEGNGPECATLHVDNEIPIRNDAEDFICPICNRKQDSLDLSEFNDHIDHCLTVQSMSAPEFNENLPRIDSSLEKVATSNASQESPECDKQLFSCPICCLELSFRSLEDFNRHVDNCLSRGAIKEMLSQQTGATGTGSQKRAFGDDSPSQWPQSKKKKIIPPAKGKTIDQFFK